jgi:hypothetical protein
MVLVVVILQRLGRHVGLKRVIGVREGREFEGHGCCSGRGLTGQEKRAGS